MKTADLLAGFFRGLHFPIAGWQFLSQNPSFRRYLILPTLLNGAITALLLVLFGWAAWESSVYVRLWIPESWWGWILRALAYTALAAASLSLVVAVSLVLSAAATSVFRGVLADKIEKALGTPASELPGLSVPQEIGEALLSLRDIVAMGAVLFLVAWVPGVGPVISLLGGWYWNAYTLGLESLDTPWALRGWKRKQKRELARRYRGETLGIGTIALLVGWVPLVGSWILSLAVVGSVLWNRQRTR